MKGMLLQRSAICTFFLETNILLRTLFSGTLNLFPFFKIIHIFYTKTGKIMILCLSRWWKHKISARHYPYTRITH